MIDSSFKNPTVPVGLEAMGMNQQQLAEGINVSVNRFSFVFD